ncbi:MFS general substrate transporter [Aulographum hederae CBS 113979]|uniref:MFS general substrate transporter n=1 Tax=Aulographum hederae CBS 113979 TaxID=1176131 RepID=A0A6G1HG64_9PEZI|nr:MFS general substrate transporter [Aulographum hederae CBS 113979]
MGWGVLDDKYMEYPPGTALIGDSGTVGSIGNEDQDTADTSHLKRHGDIILQPQPSADVNDPLNWSPLWKNSIMGILALSSGVTVSLAAMLAPGIQTIAKEYDVSFDMVTSMLLGLLGFWTGFTTFFTAAGASVWGKRPFFVIGTVILLATNIWGFAATSFPSLAAMRAIQGMASAPLETLVTSTVSDIFFVHQRGSRLAMWSVMLMSGALLGQIISGAIIERFGFQATFGFAAVIFALLLPAQYFLVPETAWNGPQSTLAKGSKKNSKDETKKEAETTVAIKEDEITKKDGEAGREETKKTDEEKETTVEIKEVQSNTSEVTTETKDKEVLTETKEVSSETTTTASGSEGLRPAFYDNIPANHICETYRSRIRLFRGRISNDSFWRGVIKPIPLVVYPAVIFATIVHGSFFTWLIVLGLLLNIVMQGPDYGLTPMQYGLTNLPLFFVTLLAAPLSGWAADASIKFMAKRNKGVFEPEFRLVLMLVAVPFSSIAYFAAAPAIANKVSIEVLIMLGCLQSFAVPFASQAALTYVIDCHPADANQAFVTINFLKAIMHFAATSQVSGWFERSGPYAVMYTVGVLNIVICAFTIPAYVYGKRFRSMVARSKLAAKIAANR